MHYPCGENKGADQLHGYREADLRLCFRICKKPVFSRRGSFNAILTSPPAAQAANKPNCPSSLINLLAVVTANLTPVAPNGWPSDKLPPHRLSLSMGGAPTYN